MTVPAFAGREGNGGGGVYRDGKYLTFGSAKVGLKIETEETVPGLKLLMSAVGQMPIYASARGSLIQAIKPIGDRKYFSIKNEDFADETRQNLYASYRAALGDAIKTETLVVYAVTNGHETFLLPEFYRLSNQQQAAVLFHEGLWVLNPNLTYKFVIDTEMLFEQYLSESIIGKRFKFNFNFFDSIGRALNDASVVILSAANIDVLEGHLKDVTGAGGWLSLSKLFGEQAIICESPSFTRSSYRIYLECNFADKNLVAHNLASLSASHPDSILFSTLLASLSRIKIHFNPLEGKALLGFGSANKKYYRNQLNGIYKLLSQPNAAGIALWGFMSSEYQKIRAFRFVDLTGIPKDEDEDFLKGAGIYFTYEN